MRQAAVVGALVVAAMAVATYVWRPQATPDKGLSVPTPAEMRRLQSEADAACRCAKRPGKELRDQGCWANFERSLARYEHSEGATSCLQESVAYVCFPSFDAANFAGNCVFRERMYGACSEDEANRKRAEARAGGNRGCGG